MAIRTPVSRLALFRRSVHSLPRADATVPVTANAFPASYSHRCGSVAATRIRGTAYGTAWTLGVAHALGAGRQCQAQGRLQHGGPPTRSVYPRAFLRSWMSAAILGATAHQLGLPSRLWCADFMNDAHKRAGKRGTGSRIGEFVRQLRPACFWSACRLPCGDVARQARRPCRRGQRHRFPRQSDRGLRQSRSQSGRGFLPRRRIYAYVMPE